MPDSTTLQKSLRIKGGAARYPIVQGGMGVGISQRELASAVSREDCVGTLSSAGLDRLVARRLLRPSVTPREAATLEVEATRRLGGYAAINIMVALQGTYEDSVRGALDGGVDVIVSGAGLPLSLPSLVREHLGSGDHEVALVPIVSSARALELICKRWEKQGYRPDAVVLEGPKAGGHLGFTYKQIAAAGERFLQEYDLFDVLLDPVLEIAERFPNAAGPLPIIVAGGIFDHADVVRALARGASAVQMGSRFAATIESGGTELFKRTLVEATTSDIVVSTESWGSPCGLPFRYVRTSPLAMRPRVAEAHAFCICTTLMAAAGVDRSSLLGQRGGLAKNCPEELVRRGKEQCAAHGSADYSALVTCGSEAHRIHRILHVRELIAELLAIPAKDLRVAEAS